MKPSDQTRNESLPSRGFFRWRRTMNGIITKIIVSTTAALLLLSCRSAEQRDWYRRGTLDMAAEKYGWLLPQVDRVEVSVLASGKASATNGIPSRVDGLSYYPIAVQKMLTGQEAKEFRNKWRAMTFWYGFSALCHEPAYGLRFFNGQELLLETTFCWKCSNFQVPTPLGYGFMGFDSDKPQAVAFWRLLQEHIPLPEKHPDRGK